MKHYTKSLFAVIFLALLLFSIGESTAVVAAADVSPGADPTAILKGAVRYKDFNNGGDREIYLGVPDLGVGGNRVEVDAVWQASNDVIYTYTPPATGNETTTVTAGSYTYNLTYPAAGTLNLGTVNYVQILVRNGGATGATVDFNNVILNGQSLGNFSAAVGETKYWKVTGMDLTSGFTLTGTILLSGTQPNSENSKVEIDVGILQFTVTPSAGAGGSIDPSDPQTVNYNETPSFTVTPNAGYHIASVTGCAGTLVNNTYTTGPITGNCTVSATFAVDPLAITTSSPLPSGDVDTPYNQTIAASGGITPYNWSVSSGSLPNGLNLNSSGAITGTPTTSGPFNFIVQVMDAASSTVTKNFSITISSDNARVVGAPPIGSMTIQASYDICPTGGIVQIQALDFIENLKCDHPVSVKLEGGYDPDFTNNSSYTVINGSMTVSDGTVTVENLIVK